MEFQVSERRVCTVTGQARSTQRRVPPKNKEECRLVARVDALVRENRCGCRRITAILELEGWRNNLKRVHRLWKQEGYRVPPLHKKKWASGMAGNACNKKRALFRNDIWTYDFIFARLENGRALKVLALTDEYTRESLALEVGTAARGDAVAAVLDRVSRERGFPRHVRSDNGSEFVSRAVKNWFSASGVQGLYVEKGAPWHSG